jgi:hypothetical protein
VGLKGRRRPAPEKVGDLKPLAGNPRTISDERLEKLGESMERWGDLGGLVFNRRSGRLVGGHQRRSHLPGDAEIELAGVRRVRPDSQGTVAVGFVVLDGQRWAYREVDVDAATEAQMNIAANVQRGEWDTVGLAHILGNVGMETLELTGLDADVLERVMAALDQGGNAEEAFAGLSQGEPEFRTMTFTVTAAEQAAVERALTGAGKKDERPGTVLARIARAWAKQKTSA